MNSSTAKDSINHDYVDAPTSTDYVRAVVNILEDIGDEKQRLETTQKAVLNILEDLEDEKRSAQEANRMKSEFLANMSHELRTPLNSIIGFSELMSDGKVGPIAENHKEYLGDILTSARHLLQLINDVLDLAKVEAGKLDFDAKPIQIHQLIHGIRDTLRSIAAARNIQVDVEIDNDIKDVIGDAARLKQVLYNYLSNALKFTPEGGQVCVSAEYVDEDYFKISVRDTGDGIAPENLSRLFIEFEQLDASIGKRHQGTGLGLALTKRIVEAQGGKVGVDSKIGVGSHFYAILPLSLRPDHLDEEPAKIAIESSQWHLPKILVVESNAIEREHYVNLLVSEGYEPQGVATGEEALNLARLQQWDAIAVDLSLSDIDGINVVSRIRAETPNETTPIIVITALPNNHLATIAVQEVLPKPTEPAALIAAIKRTEKHGKMRNQVMVIDDDPSDLKLVQQHLLDAGYQCNCFDNGQQALTSLVIEQPDIIILDLVMPAMGGVEVLEQLKLNSHSRDIPVIIWTETELSTTSQRKNLAAATSYLNKSDGHRALLTELGRHAPIPNPTKCS
ncbi:ATP-binding response regulator [Simiduia aestuariiviva]|uniref:histidine kinase n=1 Tax=Simiduia aestuariiviva TaxID=1510459 RepID=A0A839UPB4_9GAMM|nr:response regulator [Simiduia aestuariiviva]MBB3169603.1 signal transduction histidine kinase/DNA-binding response OmpR family regulator [Simiduia aestuariiviva]